MRLVCSGHTVLLHFPIKFNAQNTHVISSGHLLDHLSTLIPVQKHKRNKINSESPGFARLIF